jgi:hypothetical protein
MKLRITGLVAAMALGGSLMLASGGLVAAASPKPEKPAAAATGACATEATAVKAGATAETLHALANCEINRRNATLNELGAKITASKVLTSSDASALSGIVGATKSGLASLAATIAAESDVTALKADIAKIATEYRVYLVVVPQVNLVSGADAVLAVQAKVADINTKLSAAIAAAKAAGKDTTEAQKDLDAMNASVAAAVALASPLPAKLLPLTAASYNAGTAGPIIAAARTDLGKARDDIKSALASAKACREALK